MIEIVPLARIEPAAVERLLDRAFGTDRRNRTAYQIRGESRPVPALSFAALDSSELVGSIQCWPIRFTADDGAMVPLIMVGPVAVTPERQRDGIGKRLMQLALAATETEGLDRALMLIGDPEYYERFFGFTATKAAGWRLPGPVERHRLLTRGIEVPDGAGELGPA